MKSLTDIAWHELAAEAAAAQLESDPAGGLAQAEVEARQRQFGPNQMTAQQRLSEWMRFLLQFHQPLIYILLASTAIAAGMGEWVDASVIFSVAFINAVVGYLQEVRAENAIEALAKMVLTEATVRRGGEKLRIPSAQLVPGDVVLLQSGDRVPADLRLLLRRNLQIEEAALTGESLPAEKQTGPLLADTILADRTNLAFTGTLVTSGQGEGVIFATGDHTEMGRIAGLIHTADDLQSPLTRKIAQFIPDEPEWLSHVNAGVLKVKLATALIGISSIHLLKTFIDTENHSEKSILWQVVIHLTFVVSAVLLAWTDKLTLRTSKEGH